MSFHINPEFAAQWAEGDDAKKLLMEVGEKVAAKARELAPVKTGAYRDSIVVDSPGARVAGVPVGATGARTSYRVVAADNKAGWIEFGTGGQAPTPAYAPLRRAAEASGLKLEARRAK